MAKRVKNLLHILLTYQYLALFVFISIVYYFLLYFIVRTTSRIFTAPALLVYLLVITSALVFTIGIFGIMKARKQSGVACSVTGSLVPLVGSVVLGCGCESTVIVPFLVGIGVSASSAFGFSLLIARYTLYILSALILLNIFLLYYELGRL